MSIKMFDHEPISTVMYLYITVDGLPKPIKFYEKENPYSNTRSASGSLYERTVDSRHILTVDKLSEATKMTSLLTFTEFLKDAQAEFNAFLDEHGIKKEDIKIVRVDYEEPKEHHMSGDAIFALL